MHVLGDMIAITYVSTVETHMSASVGWDIRSTWTRKHAHVRNCIGVFMVIKVLFDVLLFLSNKVYSFLVSRWEILRKLP